MMMMTKMTVVMMIMMRIASSERQSICKQALALCKLACCIMQPRFLFMHEYAFLASIVGLADFSTRRGMFLGLAAQPSDPHHWWRAWYLQDLVLFVGSTWFALILGCQ